MAPAAVPTAALAAPSDSRTDALDAGGSAPAGPSPAGSFPTAGVRYSFPVRPGTVVRGYDAPPKPWMPGHRGVDLEVVPGQGVVAAGAGTVAFAGTVAGRPVVSVDHPDGLRTTYEPVAAVVDRGAAVTAGEEIGRIAGAHVGCPAAACLHWGARLSSDPDAYVDPLGLLGAEHTPIVLKPVG